MGEEIKTRKPHCLVVPYPITGHINPMLQFSKRLEHKGVKITFAHTEYIVKTVQNVSGTFPVETYSDGKVIDVETDIRDYLQRLYENGSKTLAQLVEKLCRSGDPLDCIVYDGFMPWTLDIAKKFGLVSAVFFTQSCAVGNIYYHVRNGSLKLPLTEDKVLIPGLPPLEAKESPSFIHIYGSYPAIFELLVDQYTNFDKADWILCNTFYELEKEVVDWMVNYWPIRTIGPTIPSMYMDKRIKDDKDYGVNYYNPNIDACMEWLDKLPDASVAYVSFGSIAELGPEQFEELAWGLKNSNVHFLWVVRSKEQAKLPQGFVKDTFEKGLVVAWCPQLKVLEHRALGCFVTHCGWNSTLEGLSFGVPMIAMPQWSDQMPNAKYIEDVWGNGIRAKVDYEKELVTREEIEVCLREIVNGSKGKECRENAAKWKALAKEAVDENGSSDKAVSEFVESMMINHV